jgi:hypothetical protein
MFVRLLVSAMKHSVNMDISRGCKEKDLSFVQLGSLDLFLRKDLNGTGTCVFFFFPTSWPRPPACSDLVSVPRTSNIRLPFWRLCRDLLWRSSF